jgi:predicted RecA/RadA family phage recombinase
MSRDLKKVRPGDPVRITAKAWNRVLSSVDTQPALTGPQAQYARHNFTALVRNNTGADLGRWGVMAITGVAVNPVTDGRAQFEASPMLVGETPTVSTGGAFCVAVEPIPAGKFGRAAIDGVVQVKLDIQSQSDNFARTKASTAELQTAGIGDAIILYKEGGIGTGKWGLVRMHGAEKGVRRGTFSAPWPKGETRTVTDATAFEKEYTAKNYFADVTSEGTRQCAVAYHGTEWILIAAEC